MKYHITIITFLYMLSSTGYGQAGEDYIKEIRQYVLMVDSLAVPSRPAGLASDPFRRVTTQLTTNSIYHKERNLIGRSITYTTGDDSSRLLYKIKSEDDLKGIQSGHYYYQYNRLVFARLELYDERDHDKVVYKREEYYMQDSLLLSELLINKVADRNRWRTEMNLLKTSNTLGSRYLRGLASRTASGRSGASGIAWNNERKDSPFTTYWSGKYKYQAFTEGKLYYRNGDSARYHFNFNYADQNMEIMGPDGKATALGNPESVRNIVIGVDQFYYDHGFLEILKQTGAATLAFRKTLRWVPPSMPVPPGSNTSTVTLPNGQQASITQYNQPGNNGNNTVKGETSYYISDTKSPFIKATKKNISKMFAEKHQMLGKYLDEKNVDFNKSDDLLALIEYLSR